MSGTFSLALIALLGALNPGPAFVLILRNASLYSRSVGVMTALGLAFGFLVHLTYSLLGLGLLLLETPWLFKTLKILGCLYLLYLGIMSFKPEPSPGQNLEIKELSHGHAFINGFLTNLLNPTIVVFFISIFASTLAPNTPVSKLFSDGLVVFTVTLLWFLFVAFAFSWPPLKAWFQRNQKYVKNTIGLLLICLSLQLLFAP